MQAQNMQEALQAERVSAKQHDSERKVLESDRIALSKEFMHEQELLRRERARLHEVEQRLRMVHSGVAGVEEPEQKFGLTGTAAGDPIVSGRYGSRSQLSLFDRLVVYDRAAPSRSRGYIAEQLAPHRASADSIQPRGFQNSRTNAGHLSSWGDLSLLYEFSDIEVKRQPS